MSAPSAGTKVKAGQNGPSMRENAGLVDSSSLAAESTREGGAFSANTGVHSENLSSNTTSRSTGSSENTSSSVGTAPSYVADQYIRDPSGPHGKNLKEGGWDESKVADGLKKAMAAEPGSIDDPSRLAEQNFQLKQSTVAGATGPRQGELTGEGAYNALKSDESA